MSRLEYLLSLTDDAPEGAAKIAALEEVIRLADQHNLEQEAYELRMALVQECVFHGQQLKALTVFPLCLAYADRQDTDCDLYDLLWQYKWICSHTSDFPEISLVKINELMDDFKKRITDYGSGIHSYYYMLMNHGVTLRDKKMAEAGYNGMQKTRRDFMSDCAACVQDGLINYWLFMGNYDEAIKTAKPIIEGKLSCAEVPHYTYANLIVPVYRAGETEKASEFAAKGYRRISRNPEFLGAMGNYLMYYAYTDINRGMTLYKKHLSWSFSAYSSPTHRYEFESGAAVLFKALQNHGKKSIKAALPKEFPLFNGDGKYIPADLYKYHMDIAAEIAAKFDKRNGNNAHTAKLKDDLDICTYKTRTE